MTVKTRWVGLLCGIALTLPVAAQDTPVPEEPTPAETTAAVPDAPAPAPKKGIEDPPLHRWGGWTISVAGWDPTLLGADEEIASVYSDGVAQPLVQAADADFEETVRVTYHLPRDAGSIVGQYDGMSVEELAQNYSPGQFKYAETRAYPLLLGAFDDGLADGVQSSSTRTTRDVRLDFQKRAFESKWARATWSIGYRQLTHSRELAIAYFAIVPNLPPVIPPIVGPNVDPMGLQPFPDLVHQIAEFSGNGIGASFDVEFTVHPRVSIVSGLALGLVRGKATSSFKSTSAYYHLAQTPDVPLTKDELFTLLTTPPSQDPDNPGVPIEDIEQSIVVVGLKGASSSQLAQSYDVYVGLQVIVYKGLRIYGTLRNVSYVNVGEYVVPKPGPTNEKTSLNAGYEGVAVGLSWRF